MLFNWCFRGPYLRLSFQQEIIQPCDLIDQFLDSIGVLVQLFVESLIFARFSLKLHFQLSQLMPLLDTLLTLLMQGLGLKLLS